MSDFLAMSDEDFLKQAAPDAPVAEPASQEAPPAEPPAAAEEPAKTDQDGQTTAAFDTPPAEAPGPDTGSVHPGSAPQEPAPAASSEAEGSSTQENISGTKEAEPGPETKPEGGQETKAAPDYEAFYKQIMAPFTANGRQVELKSPDEAIQLMQMGANYTRKMQAIAPHRKVLLMLENNGLLDPDKLSFLIDIEKKNPEAIKKLVKDAGLDPMEIDTESEPAYREGNHRVTDAEVNFTAALEDMKSSPAGLETLRIIQNDWDQASKEELWEAPEIMPAIHQQRESGVYDLIAAEVNRQRVLGRIGPEVPFLRAYKAVGDAMMAASAPPTQSQPAAAAPPVVAVRAATPKPALTNDDKASAASPTRTSAKPAQAVVNPLAMSDDEFLKLMANRL